MKKYPRQLFLPVFRRTTTPLYVRKPPNPPPKEPIASYGPVCKLEDCEVDSEKLFSFTNLQIIPKARTNFNAPHCITVHHTTSSFCCSFSHYLKLILTNVLELIAILLYCSNRRKEIKTGC